MTHTPADLDIEESRRPWWRRISAVWLVPVLALGISAYVAYSSYSDRGVLITVAFDEAAGIKADTTPLRYRDVQVGLVEEVHFAPDLSRVLVDVRVDREVAPFLDDDAAFWVAQPRVGPRGVSDLDTIVGGIYIVGSWDAEAEEQLFEFEGLDEAPQIRPDEQGTLVRLRSPDAGSMAAGAPILFRGIEVGRIEGVRLADDGDTVNVDAFIRAPHDQRLTTATRFWNVSGFSVSLDTSGVSLDVESLASLVEGGLGFDIVYTGGNPISENTVFQIFSSERAARESVFNQRLEQELRLSIEFDQSVRGLRVGDPVVYRGLEVGEVESLTVTAVSEGDDAPAEVRLLTNIVINPARMGAPSASRPEAVGFIADAVTNGLRARAAVASMLSGSLRVELAEIPDASPAALDRVHLPHPLLPAVEGDVGDYQATSAGLLDRLNNLPIEDMMGSAIALMNSVTTLTSDAATQGIPASVLGLVDGTRDLVVSDDVRALPGDLRLAIGEVNSILTEINEGGAVASVLATLEDAQLALADISAATSELPQVIAGIDTLLTSVNTLPLDGLVADTRGLMTSATGLLGSEAVAAIPEQVAGLIGDTRAILASPALQTAPDQLQAALVSVNVALDEFTSTGGPAQITSSLAAAEAVSRQVQDALPGLIAGSEDLLATANALDFQALLAEVRGLIGTTDGLLAGEAVQAVPAELAALLADSRALVTSEAIQSAPERLAATLETVDGLIAEIAAGGAVARLNETLASVAVISDGLETSLPGLTEEIEAVLATARALDLEGLVADTRGLVGTADGLIGSPETAAIPAEVSALLSSVRSLVDSPAVQTAPQELQSALAAADRLLTSIVAGGSVTQLESALTAAASAAAEVDAAIPSLLTEIDTLLANANAVPLAALSADAQAALVAAEGLLSDPELQRIGPVATGLLEDVRALVGSEDLQAAPAELRSALSTLDGLLSDLAEGGSVAEIETTLATAARVAAEIEAAAPGLLEGVDTLLANANAVPLAALSADAQAALVAAEGLLSDPELQRIGPVATGLLEDVRALVASEDLQAAPAELRSALSTLDGLLSDLAEGGSVAEIETTLATAARVAAEIEAAAPGLLEGVDTLLANANAVPLAALSADAQAALAAAEGLLADPELARIGTMSVGLLDDLRALIGSEAVQQAPLELRSALVTLDDLLTDVAESGSVAELEASLAAAGRVAAEIEGAVPGLLGDLDTLLASANTLPLDALSAEARTAIGSVNAILSDIETQRIAPLAAGVLGDLRALLASEAVQTAPAELTAALRRLESILATFEDGQGTEALVAALVEAREAAANLNDASGALPGLSAELTRLTETAADLPLEALVSSARGFIETADALIASPAVRELPGSFTAALDRLRSFVATLEDGGAVDNLNTALSSAATASDAIAAAAADLPELAARLEQLADQAAATLSAYDDESSFNYDARAALREIRQASEAVTSLSRAIERRPNSILIGR